MSLFLPIHVSGDSFSLHLLVGRRTEGASSAKMAITDSKIRIAKGDSLFQSLGDCLSQTLKLSKIFSPSKIIWHRKQKKIVIGNDHYVDFASFIWLLGRAEMPHIAQKIFVEMKSDSFQPCLATLSALMLCHAENGLFSHAKSVWEEIIASSFVANIEVVSDLMNAYGKMGHFNEVIRILHEVTSRDFDLSPEVYSVAISCFGKGRQLEMMEATMKEMVQSDFSVDSATANAFVSYYAVFGSLTESLEFS